MKSLFARLTSTLALLLIMAPVGHTEALEGIYKLRQPSSSHYAAGQPQPEQFQQLQQAGIQHVINFRPQQEQGSFDEAEAVKALGMDYHNIAIASPADLSADKVRQLDQLLADIGEEKTLLHCASSNRVGAMMALRANWLQGVSPAEALELGRSYGMTRLEATVKPLLK